MRWFKDERYDSPVSEEEVRKDYNLYLEVMPFKETKNYTFEDYIKECCSKNGTLTEIKEEKIMKEKKVYSTEYAVEINDEETGRFLRQVECFQTYDEAEEFADNPKNQKEWLNEGQYFNIIFIDYDENGDEIEFGTVC